jgi:Phage-related protein
VRKKTIYNPENFPSLPIVRLYGMGTLTVVINGSTYTVNNVNTYVIIDCESQNVYSRVGTANMNSNAQFRRFPKLIVGNNYIEKLSGTTKVEIEPRWRTK